MNTDLPFFLTVDGIDREIYSDFRDVIKILVALQDPEVPNGERNLILLNNLFVDDWTVFTDIDEALKQAKWFMDCGKEYKEVNENSPQIINWAQDYGLICEAVNKVINVLEVRQLKYLHWWTFCGYFGERGECRISTFAEIRDKMNKGKKLEKYEKEILRENREQIIIQDKRNADFENEIFGGD